ncbi:aminotransferase class V-fold PLP-dependent enzyme [Streptomyces sp. NPDC048442]|uniref:aminotransferase class V-fold PLP-dependent enzyme n=1 Tax=Streptomyces sp. NPDC048442 TaxID=3154823 RepID=UPI0034352171
MSTPQPATRTGPGAPHPDAHSRTAPGTEPTLDAGSALPPAQAAESESSDAPTAPEDAAGVALGARPAQVHGAELADVTGTGPAHGTGAGPASYTAAGPAPSPAHIPGASSTPSTPTHHPLPPLSGGEAGPEALRPLLSTVLTALTTGAAARSGPLPAGGPRATAEHLRGAAGPLLPTTGTGPHEALRTLVHALAAGAADPAHPHCAAHLHCPPLAVAVAADLAASALNPSMDSWDQAPAASALEETLTRTIAAEVYPGTACLAAEVQGDPTHSAAGGHPGAADPATEAHPSPARLATDVPPGAAEPAETHPHAPHPDALITTGGTESNQLALLLAREKHAGRGPLQLVVGANAHHSLSRAAWLLGLPEPVVVPAPAGTLDLAALDEALTRLRPPSPGSRPRATLVAATAGTTDTGQIDPIPEIADLCDQHGADLHIDAAYGGPLLFSRTHRHLLHGLDRAHTVTLDLHKLGWQPVAAGLLAVRDATALAPLAHQADYLNADDDTDAGLPDLLGRSLRTSRRPDVLKIAVTLKSLGRDGLADLIDRTLAAAQQLADLVETHPDLELYDRPTLSTVLFRRTGASDHETAEARRRLLAEGRAVLGRTHASGHLWWKATLLNPHTTPADLKALLDQLITPSGD